MRLRRQGYNRTKIWLDRRRSPGARLASSGAGDGGAADGGASGEDPQVEAARELAFVVRLAARAIPDATCLRKGLVLQHLLAERGVPATVQFGAGRTQHDSELSFHAWVEVHGQVVSEEAKAVAGYTTLMDRPPPDASEQST